MPLHIAAENAALPPTPAILPTLASASSVFGAAGVEAVHAIDDSQHSPHSDDTRLAAPGSVTSMPKHLRRSLHQGLALTDVKAEDDGNSHDEHFGIVLVLGPMGNAGGASSGSRDKMDVDQVGNAVQQAFKEKNPAELLRRIQGYSKKLADVMRSDQPCAERVDKLDRERRLLADRRIPNGVKLHSSLPFMQTV